MKLKLINLYLTPTRCSITVDGAVSQQVAGEKIEDVLRNMHDDDRAAFVALCTQVAVFGASHVTTTPVTDASERTFLRRVAAAAGAR
jgi:hypothetical protein